MIDDSGSTAENRCTDAAQRRNTAIAVFKTLDALDSTAIAEDGIRFAAIKFAATKTQSKLLFDFQELGHNKSSILTALERMQLESTGATVIDSGFTEARDLLEGPDALAHGFRGFVNHKLHRSHFKKKRDLRCVLHPSLPLGCWVQNILESQKIKKEV